MAIEYSAATISYKGNGSSTTFDFDFPVRESEHIEVKLLSPEFVVSTLAEGADYTVLPKGGVFPTDTGGTITYPTSSSGLPPLASGWVLTISRVAPYTQPDVYPENSSLNPKAIETSLDNLEMQIQQINDKTSNSVQIPPGMDFNNDSFVARLFEAEKNAKTSEANAKASEINAKASEVSASNSADSAKNSETSASQSAQTATTKAGEAKSSADSASQSAQTATTKAGEASSSATSAKDSEDKAKQYADEAKSSADSVGNPVRDITVRDDKITVSKSGTESMVYTIDNVQHATVTKESSNETPFMVNPAKQNSPDITDNTPNVIFKNADGDRLGIYLANRSDFSGGHGAIFKPGVGLFMGFEGASQGIVESDLYCNFPQSPTAPTPSINDKSTKLANTDWVKQQLYLQRNTADNPLGMDFNNYYIEGLYSYGGLMENSYIPGSGVWGSLLVINQRYGGGSGTNGVYVYQIAFSTFHNIAYRSRTNEDSWTSWTYIASEDFVRNFAMAKAPTRTIIMDTWQGSGDINLSQSWRNFDELLFVLTTDDRNYCHFQYVRTADFSTWLSDSTYPPYYDLGTGWNWNISRSGTTDTVLKLQAESAGIQKVIGIKY